MPKVLSHACLCILLFADVSIPDDLPTFRTIPQKTIVLSEEDSIGVLACSIQRNNDNRALVVRQEPGGIIITGFSFFPPELFGYAYFPQTNLQINVTDLDNPTAFTNQTYVCSLDGTGIGHSTTFIREGMYGSSSYPVSCRLGV